MDLAEYSDEELLEAGREAVKREQWLRAAPDNFLLLRMRKRLGVRQAPPLPFLDRRHALNVRLGRIMHKIKGTSPSMLPA